MVKLNEDIPSSSSTFYIDSKEMALLYRALSFVVLSRITIDDKDEVDGSTQPFVDLMVKISKQLELHDIPKQ